MAKLLFENKAQIVAAVSAFTTLMAHPGWELMEQILKENIEIARQQLEDGVGAEETKADVDRTRDRLKVWRETLNTPRDMIEKLQTPEDQEPSVDPFDTEETIKKRREADQEDTA